MFTPTLKSFRPANHGRFAPLMESLQNQSLIRNKLNIYSDFILPFLPPYMGVIPKPKMAFIFPISCILVLIFPIFIIYFPNLEEKLASQNPK